MDAQETFETRQNECLELVYKIGEAILLWDSDFATRDTCTKITDVLRRLQVIGDVFGIERNDIADEQLPSVAPRNEGVGK